MGAYVKDLPSTPQMARYTAAPSAYADPTVAQSVPAWWGSSLGSCGSCGFGQAPPAAGTVAAPSTPLSGLADRRLLLLAAGATIGYFIAPKSKHGWYVAGGAIGGLLLAQMGFLTFK